MKLINVRDVKFKAALDKLAIELEGPPPFVIVGNSVTSASGNSTAGTITVNNSGSFSIGRATSGTFTF